MSRSTSLLRQLLQMGGVYGHSVGDPPPPVGAVDPVLGGQPHPLRAFCASGGTNIHKRKRLLHVRTAVVLSSVLLAPVWLAGCQNAQGTANGDLLSAEQAVQADFSAKRGVTNAIEVNLHMSNASKITVTGILLSGEQHVVMPAHAFVAESNDIKPDALTFMVANADTRDVTTYFAGVSVIQAARMPYRRWKNLSEVTSEEASSGYFVGDYSVFADVMILRLPYSLMEATDCTKSSCEHSSRFYRLHGPAQQPSILDTFVAAPDLATRVPPNSQNFSIHSALRNGEKFSARQGIGHGCLGKLERRVFGGEPEGPVATAYPVNFVGPYLFGQAAIRPRGTGECRNQPSDTTEPGDSGSAILLPREPSGVRGLAGVHLGSGCRSVREVLANRFFLREAVDALGAIDEEYRGNAEAYCYCRTYAFRLDAGATLPLPEDRDLFDNPKPAAENPEWVSARDWFNWAIND